MLFLSEGSRSRSLFSRAMIMKHYLYTVWLFPCQQVYDTILPYTIFAVCAVLSGETLGLPPAPSPMDAVQRTPLTAFWTWLLCLQFTLHNQRLPEGIAEDAINKPWRPLPAGRITSAGANRLLAMTYIATAAVSYYFSVFEPFFLFSILTIWYNDLRGGDSFLGRAFLLAGTSVCFFQGSLQIAAKMDRSLSDRAWMWISIMVLVNFTTIHAQEFRDIEGDEARGRRTIITVLGNKTARGILMLGVAFWCVFIPRWFAAGWLGTAVPWVFGLRVIMLTAMGMFRKNNEIDKAMYKSWGMWLWSLSPLPLITILTL